MDTRVRKLEEDVALLRDLEPLFQAMRQTQDELERRYRSQVADLSNTAAALHESEELFHLLVESVRDYAIFILSPEGTIQTWNRGAERLKGYKADEIIGKHFSVFYSAEDLNSGKPARELEIAIAAGRVEDEGWRIRKDGSRFWANVVITAMRDSSGVLRGFGKVTRDMSERRKAEQNLAERSKQLESTNADLEAFTYSVSHDLRAPLRAMHSLSEALQEDF